MAIPAAPLIGTVASALAGAGLTVAADKAADSLLGTRSIAGKPIGELKASDVPNMTVQQLLDYQQRTGKSALGLVDEAARLTLRQDAARQALSQQGKQFENDLLRRAGEIKFRQGQETAATQYGYGQQGADNDLRRNITDRADLVDKTLDLTRGKTGIEQTAADRQHDRVLGLLRHYQGMLGENRDALLAAGTQDQERQMAFLTQRGKTGRMLANIAGIALPIAALFAR